MHVEYFAILYIILYCIDIFSLTGQELYKVFKCVREKLKEHDICQEVVIIHLDLNTFDIVYYVPVIFAIISTGNVFYFLNNQKDLKQVKS